MILYNCNIERRSKLSQLAKSQIHSFIASFPDVIIIGVTWQQPVMLSGLYNIKQASGSRVVNTCMVGSGFVQFIEQPVKHISFAAF